MTGYFEGTVDFGGANLISAGSADLFVAKFSGADGAHLRSRRFGSTSEDIGLAVEGGMTLDAVLAEHDGDVVAIGRGGGLS